MNKDNIYSNVSYDSEGRGTNQYAYFQMKYPGNYVVLDNYSNNAGSFGGDHLFECLCTNEGYTYRVRIGKPDAIILRVSVLEICQSR